MKINLIKINSKSTLDNFNDQSISHLLNHLSIYHHLKINLINHSRNQKEQLSTNHRSTNYQTANYRFSNYRSISYQTTNSRSIKRKKQVQKTINKRSFHKIDKSKNVIKQTTKIKLNKPTLILNLSQFRFKIKQWLLLFIILLNLSLHSSFAQTTEQYNQTNLNCSNLSNRLNSSFLLSENICVNSSKIIIGYLTNYNSSTGQPLGLTDVGAIHYAISQVNNHQILGPDRKLDMLIADTRANPVFSTNSMLSQVSKGAVAFMGPDNTCLTEATVSAALNLPMISYKCSDQKVSDKTTYHTFARTIAPDTGIVNSVLSSLKHYNWHNVSLIYKDKENFRKIAENLIEKAGNHFTIEPRRRFPDKSECCLTNQLCCQFSFKEIIEEVAKRTRIWIFIGDRKEVISFMKLFKNYNLHLNGHFVVIVDTTDWDNSINIRYLEDKMDDELNTAYRATMMITFSPPDKEKYENFVRAIENDEEIKNEQKKNNNDLNKFVTLYACYLYDAVFLYAKALRRVLNRGLCANNGREIIQEIIKNITKYESVCGSTMQIDENGDVLGNYTVFAYKDLTEINTSNQISTSSNNLDQQSSLQNQYSKQFIPIGLFKYNNNNSSNDNSKFDNTLVYEAIENMSVDWIDGEQPVDQPECGFDGSKCNDFNDFSKKLFVVLLVVLVILVFITIFIYRNYRHEQEIQGLLWNIKLDNKGYDDDSYSGYCCTKRTFTTEHKGRLVSVRQLRFLNHKFELSIDIKKEMSIIKNLHHDNLNQFIGADLEHLSHFNRIYLVTEYCEKGSLQDILSEEKFHLGTIITASFINDLLSALSYLNKSEIKFHGNLKSSNCLITSRIILKISEFGLHHLRMNNKKCDENCESCSFDPLWKPPEQLREEEHCCKQHLSDLKDATYVTRMQKGDIYSFSIILHEIIVREGPFNLRIKGETKDSLELKTRRIIENLKRESSYVTLNKFDKQFELTRPIIPEDKCEAYIAETMRECWCERPEDRLDIDSIKKKLKPLQDTLKKVMDDTSTLLLTNYNENLEYLVNQRTKQVILLLQRMLPNSVAQQLMDGKTVETESFDSVTIFFSDIVGFTTMARKSEPRQIVNFLNDLYTLFDDIIKKYDVYKVETIGDAYMVGSGFPKKPVSDQETNHAVEIANMALELLESTKSFKIEHQPGEQLKLRIGIHTGPICAGVVGKTMPRYCVFGDTVNYASRMESTGEPFKIHISDATKTILENSSDDYTFQCRGQVNIKGIGEQTTWWLSRNTTLINNSTSTMIERPMKMSSSKDILYNRIRSDNNCQRRASGIGLREKSIPDFSIMQNAVKSNRNLIDSIIPEKTTIQPNKVNHSENHLLLHHNSSFIELPNGKKNNLNQRLISGNRINDTDSGRLLMNGNREIKQFYDFEDRLIDPTDQFCNQFNDPNSSEQYDSYEDNSFNLDNCYYTKQQRSKNKKFQIGKSNLNENDYYSSNENLDKKSKSCTDLKICYD